MTERMIDLRGHIMPFIYADKMTERLDGCSDTTKALHAIANLRSAYERAEDLLHTALEDSRNWQEDDVLNGKHNNEILPLYSAFWAKFEESIRQFEKLDNEFSSYEIWHEIKKELGHE